ncbi:MAG: DUF6494 family protein [Pseudolabrys sp.]|jgi:hypothetical protein
MDEEIVKAAVGQFLKNISFNAQRELERAVRSALESGKLHNGEALTTAVTLSNSQVDLDVTIFSKIEL